jgi:hypothetical protein
LKGTATLQIRKEAVPMNTVDLASSSGQAVVVGATGEVGAAVVVRLRKAGVHSPLGQMTTVDQVSWAVAQLLAPEADALHGATLALDGGARRGLF